MSGHVNFISMTTATTSESSFFLFLACTCIHVFTSVGRLDMDISSSGKRNVILVPTTFCPSRFSDQELFGGQQVNC